MRWRVGKGMIIKEYYRVWDRRDGEVQVQCVNGKQRIWVGFRRDPEDGALVPVLRPGWFS
jgi:hypothetical protein